MDLRAVRRLLALTLVLAGSRLAHAEPAVPQTAPAATQPALAAPATTQAPAADPAAPAHAVAPTAEPPVPETTAPPATQAPRAEDEAAPTTVATPYGDAPWFPVKTTRRYGFTFGLTAGLALQQASGSPIKFTQRDRTVATSFAPGLGYTIFLGAVLTDWFAFHLGASVTNATSGDYQLAGGAFIIGVEAWPLFTYGGVFRNLGLGADFGTGAATVKSKATGETLADGGGMSLVRGTAFWDAVQFGSFSFGPYVAYERRDADTFSENIGWLGGRLAFYGNQPLRSSSVREAEKPVSHIRSPVHDPSASRIVREWCFLSACVDLSLSSSPALSRRSPRVAGRGARRTLREAAEAAPVSPENQAPPAKRGRPARPRPARAAERARRRAKAEAGYPEAPDRQGAGYPEPPDRRALPAAEARAREAAQAAARAPAAKPARAERERKQAPPARAGAERAAQEARARGWRSVS